MKNFNNILENRGRFLKLSIQFSPERLKIFKNVFLIWDYAAPGAEPPALILAKINF